MTHEGAPCRDPAKTGHSAHEAPLDVGGSQTSALIKAPYNVAGGLSLVANALSPWMSMFGGGLGLVLRRRTRPT